jgi:ribosomal protein S18 acetylase RimI-like enzyme
MTIASLVWATDIDVLPLDRIVERREGYVLIRSPSNPSHWWGNFLLFDEPPEAGDGGRWEALFETEFGQEPGVRHRAFAWDRVDGSEGEAEAEFISRGYEPERAVGLLAAPSELQPHPRQNEVVLVRRLSEADDELWEQVLELQLAMEDRSDEQLFIRRRLHDQRALFQAGRGGGWYVALDPVTGEVVGSLGIVVTGGRARFQTVDTAPAHQRRGICSRLVVEAARHAAQHWSVRQFAIVAAADYHALGLYESLGFQARERVAGACRRPPS